VALVAPNYEGLDTSLWGHSDVLVAATMKV